MPLVVFEVASEQKPAIAPRELAESTLFVQHVRSHILLLFQLGDPYAFPESQTLLEIALVLAPIQPVIFPHAFRKPVDEVSPIRVPIRKVLLTLAMFEAIFEIAIINVSIGLLV